MRALIWQITPFRLLMTCLVAIGYSGQAEEIRITSYNAGLLTSTGFNLVPCTTERTEPQAQVLLDVDPNVHFAVLLQEVWTQYGFDTYQRIATEKGFTMFPTEYNDVAYNGEIIITNMKVLKHTFVQFPDDDHAYRGIRSVVVESEKGPVVISDVHTSYSDSTGFLPQHREQFKVISQFLDEVMKTKDLSILAGDFNAGPNMSYRQALYNPAKAIWEDTILPVFTSHGMRPFGDEAQNTWSEETNTLVSYPARVIRWMNWYEYGISEWDQNSARLDHIMASDEMHTLETGRTMLQGAVLPWTCTGRADANGRTPLSDHYAVYARFMI
jgi:exonuclease III